MPITRIIAILLLLALLLPAIGKDLAVPPGATLALDAPARYGAVTVAGTLVLRGAAVLHVQALTVQRGGVVTHDGPVKTAEAAARIDITADTLTIMAGGRIDATGKGFAGGVGHALNDDPTSAGFGPGAGGYPKVWGASSGGSHGGRGGTAIATDTYDAVAQPTQPGSGGGGGNGIGGGAGGGVIRLSARAMRIDGTVAADGGDGRLTSYGGAGAGGSIILVAERVTGTGLVSAIGGRGSIYAGGGGGGRIAVTARGRAAIRFTVAGGCNGIGFTGTEEPKHFGEAGTLWSKYALPGRVLPHSAQVSIAGKEGKAMTHDDTVAYWMPWKVNTPIVQVEKSRYRTSPRNGAAALTSRWYVGPKLEMLEFVGVEARDDVWSEVGLHWSTDNGRTWSALEPRPDTVRMVKDVEVWEGFVAQEYDPQANVLVGIWLRQIQTGNIWAGGLCNCFAYVRLSRDGGRTWSEPEQLTYEPGAPFDPAAPLKPDFLLHNQAYPGSGILRHSNGTLVHCVCMANDPGDPSNDTRTWKLGSLCFIGKWDAKKGQYTWNAGQRIAVSPEVSSRGLLEPDLAELDGGRVLVVWRGSDTPTTPGRKWYSISADGGKTLGPIREWGYDDGTGFYSPSSIHRFIRHSNGTLYWFGNICPNPPSGNGPRFPLVIAEVDQRTGLLKRDTVTAVDDRDENEGFDLQLSNFSIYENRETHNLELFLTRYGHQPGQENWLNADSWHYVLTLTK